MNIYYKKNTLPFQVRRFGKKLSLKNHNHKRLFSLDFQYRTMQMFRNLGRHSESNDR